MRFLFLFLVAVSGYGAAVTNPVARVGNYSVGTFRSSNYLFGVTQGGSNGAARLFSIGDILDVAATENEGTNTIRCTSVSEITNAYLLARSNIAANPTLKYQIRIAAGTYYFTDPNFCFYFTNNIKLKGEGAFLTTLVTANDGARTGVDHPFIVPGGTFEMEDLTIWGTNNIVNPSTASKLFGNINAARAPQGNSYHCSNSIVRRCIFAGEDDCIYIDNSGDGLYPVRVNYRFDECKFYTRFDCLLLSATVEPYFNFGGDFTGDDSTRVAFYECEFNAVGPSIALANRGTTTCLNASGFIWLDLYNCKIYSQNATQLTSGLFYNGTGIDVSIINSNGAPGVKLFGCIFDVGSTSSLSAVWAITNINGRVQTYACDFGTNGIIAAGYGIFASPQVYGSAGTQSIASNGAIVVSGQRIRVVGSGGAVTCNATTSISNGTDGQVIYIIGTSDSNTVTISDNSNVQLQSASRVLGNRDVLTLMFDSAINDWIELSFANN